MGLLDVIKLDANSFIFPQFWIWKPFIPCSDRIGTWYNESRPSYSIQSQWGKNVKNLSQIDKISVSFVEEFEQVPNKEAVRKKYTIQF